MINFGLIVAISLFVFSVLATNLLWDNDDEEVRQRFGSLGAASWTLFKMMTLDSWTAVAEKVLGNSPGALRCARPPGRRRTAWGRRRPCDAEGPTTACGSPLPMQAAWSRWAVGLPQATWSPESIGSPVSIGSWVRHCPWDRRYSHARRRQLGRRRPSGRWSTWRRRGIQCRRCPCGRQFLTRVLPRHPPRPHALAEGASAAPPALADPSDPSRFLRHRAHRRASHSLAPPSGRHADRSQSKGVARRHRVATTSGVAAGSGVATAHGDMASPLPMGPAKAMGRPPRTRSSQAVRSPQALASPQPIAQAHGVSACQGTPVGHRVATARDPAAGQWVAAACGVAACGHRSPSARRGPRSLWGRHRPCGRRRRCGRRGFSARGRLTEAKGQGQRRGAQPAHLPADPRRTTTDEG